MSVEDFLARLYTDRDLLRRFLVDRPGESRKAGLVECDIEAMCAAERRPGHGGEQLCKEAPRPRHAPAESGRRHDDAVAPPRLVQFQAISTQTGW
jgi:hypothetical protein